MSDEGVTRLWAEKRLTDVIDKMEAREKWAVDGPMQTVRSLVTSREVIDVLVEVLSDPDGPRRLSAYDGHVARFMAHLRAGRALALFRYLLDHSPATAISMVRQGVECMILPEAHGEERFMRLLYERMRVLENSRILSRVFAPHRIADLLEALDDTRGSALLD